MSAAALGRIAVAVWIMTAGVAAAQAAEVSTPATVRKWTDSTGRYHMVGSLVEADHSQVRLRRDDGPVVVVPVTRLSAEDQRFVSATIAARSIKAVPKTASAIELGQWCMDVAVRAVTDLYRVVRENPLLSDAAEVVPENMVYIRVSGPLLQRLARREVDVTAPVYDQILSARVVGTSRTVGQTELTLLPCREAGLAELHFIGTTTFNTVGYARPVQIYSTGSTRFHAVKTIWMDERGIHAAPAKTNAQTASRINDIQTSLPRLLGRISLRIAWNRAAQSHALSEAITSEHAGRRVNKKLDAETTAEFNDVWKKAQGQLAALPAGNPLRPRGITASSSANGLQIVVLGPRREGNRAAIEPFRALDQADLEVQIHVSAVRQALANAEMNKLLRPVMVHLVSSQRPRPAADPKIQWSTDGKWLSLAWKAEGDDPNVQFVDLLQAD